MQRDAIAFISATIAAIVPFVAFIRTAWFAYISSRRFRSTNGRIVSHYQPLNDDGAPVQLRLRYTYSVNGREYNGSRYFFGSLNTTDERLLELYPVGSSVSVFYDPDFPARSTLLTGLSTRLLFWLACVCVASPLIWLGVWVLVGSQWAIDSNAPSSLP